MYHQCENFWHSNTVHVLFPLVTGPGPQVLFGYCFVYHTSWNIMYMLCMFAHIGLALESPYTVSALFYFLTARRGRSSRTDSSSSQSVSELSGTASFIIILSCRFPALKQNTFHYLFVLYFFLLATLFLCQMD